MSMASPTLLSRDVARLSSVPGHSSQRQSVLYRDAVEPRQLTSFEIVCRVGEALDQIGIEIMCPAAVGGASDRCALLGCRSARCVTSVTDRPVPIM
jgi:hypothetical protein